MRQLLWLHPESRSSVAQHVEVVVTRPRPEGLVLSYKLSGRVDDVYLPAVRPTAGGDELWQHTCFEAFVRASSGSEYYEFNFSPSTQWAVYRFTDYRNGMCVAAEVSTPPIDVRLDAQSFTLQAALALDHLSLPRESSWRLGLSAVIEETNGNKTYWALAHPPGKPDFHHKDAFAYELSPAVHP
ncbi:MAG: DOMON-like domain-containing protein [Pseudolabrys sp.]